MPFLLHPDPGDAGLPARILWRILEYVNATAAVSVIRECIATNRVIIKAHFTDRMSQRGLFWPDVVAVLEEPTRVRADGHDEFGRSRWLISGAAADGLDIEMLCVIDDEGPTTVFVTLYWQE